MSRNEEIISFVDSNLRLEGMSLSAMDKQALRNCLSGKTTFDKEIKRTLAEYRRAVA